MVKSAAGNCRPGPGPMNIPEYAIAGDATVCVLPSGGEPGTLAAIEDLIFEISATGDYRRRLPEIPEAPHSGIARAINGLLAEMDRGDAKLRQRVDDLVSARDEAQTSNLLLRRVNEDLYARSVQLDAALQKAGAASSAKSQFLADMSHEIRTPLNGILGMAELILRSPLDEKQTHQIDTILRSGCALLKIINDVLDFSKIEAGRFELDPHPFDLRHCLNDIGELLRPSATGKGLRLEVECSGDLPDCYVGDAGRIRQIVMNLVGNSVKFTERGSVTIRLTGTRQGATAALAIDIIDTGIGIPEERLADVFDKFSQLDNTSNRRCEGTGLGLSISRLLAERMGGTLHATSKDGEGSVFSLWLDLPVHEEGLRPAPQIARRDANAAPARGSRRVLLVDDSRLNQEVALELLHSMQCAVTVAGNGAEALEAVRAAAFDLVLMDCQMPVMDGYGATTAIRSERHTPTPATVPIVALTANAFASDREKCLKAGMSDFLCKPFMLLDFEVVVEKWLALGASTRSASAAMAAR